MSPSMYHFLKITFLTHTPPVAPFVYHFPCILTSKFLYTPLRLIQLLVTKVIHKTLILLWDAIYF